MCVSVLDIAQQSEPYRNIGKIHVLYSFNFVEISGIARNLIWGGVYVLTSLCYFKTCANVSHVNKTVTDFGVYIPIYPPPVATPLVEMASRDLQI